MSERQEIAMGRRMDGGVRQKMGVIERSLLAITNSHDASDQPKPGERLKIAVGG
jgi:hypothetical protein